MLTNIVLGNILYYISYVLGSFSFFATGWLYLDSYFTERKRKLFFVRGFSFIVFAITNLYFSTQIESSTFELFAKLILLMSLAIIAFSFFLEKTLEKPKLENYLVLLPLNIPFFVKSFVNPQIFLTSLFATFVILYKSTKGKDKQLKMLFFGFLFYSLSSFFSIFLNTSGVESVFWLDALKLYGTVWYLHLIFYFISVTLIGFWSFGYLRFRTGPQIFISLVATTIFIFSVTATLFNFVLIRNIEKDSYKNLETNAKLVKYNLENLQLQTISITESISFDSDIMVFIENDDKDGLYQKASEYISSKKISNLIFIDNSGKVLLRTSDREIYGDDLSNEQVVASSINGQELSVIQKEEGVIFPTLSIKSAVPVYNSENDFLGVVVVGTEIDSAFVDGIKKVTGLDTDIFVENVRAASTLLSEDGVSRLVGTKEVNENILNKVLTNNENFAGKNSIGNIPYYSYYIPLTSYEDEVVGMISVGRPQLEIVNVTKDNIKLTFIGSVILMVLSVFPSLLLARYMERNLNS